MKSLIRGILLSSTLLLSACTVHVSRDQTESLTFDQAITTTLNELHNYWTTKLSNYPTDFVPPPIFMYDSPKDLTCGQKPVAAENAIYCSKSIYGKYIAYDVSFMREGFNTYGPSWVYFIFAHEYGHAVQDHVDQTFSGEKAQELQADCLGGAFISEMIQLNRMPITQQDVSQMTAIMNDLGDSPRRNDSVSPEEGHGTGQQRYQRFYDGFNGRISACDLRGVS